MSAPTPTTLVVKRFWTEYKPSKDDPNRMEEIDKVELSHVGMLSKMTTIHTVKSLLAVQPMADRDNPAVTHAHDRAAFVRPRYEAWKAGQEMPVTGTPLAAWNGVTPEQASILKAAGIRTVEEVAAVNDSIRAGIKLPNLMALVDAARRWVAASDTRQFAASMAEKDHQLMAQKAELESYKEAMNGQSAQIADLMEKMNSLAVLVASKDDSGDDPNKPRRGRPPKVRETEPETANSE